jgi:hypothetical protein
MHVAAAASRVHKSGGTFPSHPPSRVVQLWQTWSRLNWRMENITFGDIAWNPKSARLYVDLCYQFWPLLYPRLQTERVLLVFTLVPAEMTSPVQVIIFIPMSRRMLVLSQAHGGEVHLPLTFRRFHRGWDACSGG